MQAIIKAITITKGINQGFLSDNSLSSLLDASVKEELKPQNLAIK